MAPNFCPNCGCSVEDRSLTECAECGEDFSGPQKDEYDEFEEPPDAPEFGGDTSAESVGDDVAQAEDFNGTTSGPASKKLWTDRIAACGLIVFYLYWLGVIVAAPYFNWEYARRNGFMRWFLLGEIVPTLKATVWPYYASTAWFQQRPSRKDFEQFSDSLLEYQEAIRVTNSIPIGQVATDQQRTEFLNHIRKAIELGQGVNAAELNRTHAGFGDHFENEYMAGLRAYDSRDPSKVDMGDELLRRWVVWLDKNGRDLSREFNPD